MERNLVYELQQMGLDKNEASVYLAALELGPSPVQKIAQRARVPRATTYLVLDELKKKGLVSTYEHGKKIYFTALNPSQLEGYLKKQENELKVRQKTLESLVPELEKRGQFPESVRPRVRYYEGKDSFSAFKRDLYKSRKEQKLVRSILDVQGLAKVVGDITQISKTRVQENVKSKVLYVDPEHKPFNDPNVMREGMELQGEKYPIKADVSIIGNSVALMPYGDPFRAVIIEDEDVASALNSIFELAWIGAEKLNKKD